MKETKKKIEVQTTRYLLDAFLLCLGINIFLSWIPVSCVLCFFGALAGTSYLQRKFVSKSSNKLALTMYVWLGSLLSSSFVAYLSLLYFFMFMGKSSHEPWVVSVNSGLFEYFNYLVRDSVAFKRVFFSSNLCLGFLSTLLGHWVAFKYGRWKRIEPEEQMLSKMTLDELEVFIER